MAERAARLGSMHYLDSDGRYRTASAGDTIQVHPDFVERFDRLNVLLGESFDDPTPRLSRNPETAKKIEKSDPENAVEVPVDKPVPKRRGRPRKTVE